MKILNFPFMKSLWYWMVKTNPQFCCKLLYRKSLGRRLNLDNPKDLNEKIQWLKFNINQETWAKLADKYAVRDYVSERLNLRGGHLTILYGKYDTPEELLDDWKNLPDKFVLKSNNSCGTVKIIKDKSKQNLEKLKAEITMWLRKKDIGIGSVEPHYNLIKPCLLAEELLEDTSVAEYSQSLIDYKIWCFNGEPFCCAAIYDRDVKNHKCVFDLYDLDFKPIRQYVTHADDRNYKVILPKPQNWTEMLEVAKALSKGHPQVRVDLYNVNGKIYFGELTFTAKGGYQDDYSEDLLLTMGCKIDLHSYGNNINVDKKHT